MNARLALNWAGKRAELPLPRTFENHALLIRPRNQRYVPLRARHRFVRQVSKDRADISNLAWITAHVEHDPLRLLQHWLNRSEIRIVYPVHVQIKDAWLQLLHLLRPRLFILILRAPAEERHRAPRVCAGRLFQFQPHARPVRAFKQAA